jgi:hypothetical protein
MQTALKLDACSCGIHTETSCSGCGTPVCRHCRHLEITTFDPKHITVAMFCPTCKTDPKINSWGTLYWEGLAGLFT